MRDRRWYCQGIVGLMLMLCFPWQVMASEVGPGVPRASEPVEQQLMIPEAGDDVRQIIVVEGDHSSHATVTYYKRSETDSLEMVFEVPAYCGYNGLTADKREGDRKTPTGTYQFDLAFGIYDDPGSVLPYHKVTKTDYWVDDANSSYYNKLVDTRLVAKTWSSAEHLIKIVPQYHYALSLNYNQECVPGKGSAIFLHGYHSTKTWTEGCIAIPEENMKQLLGEVDADTVIVIRTSASDSK